MNRYCKCLGLLILTTSMLTGCASRPARTGIVFSPDTHLIFNPGWTGMATVDTPRSAWPSTTIYHPPGEISEFRETTIDIQGRNGYSNNNAYRRFESTRSGFHNR